MNHLDVALILKEASTEYFMFTKWLQYLKWVVPDQTLAIEDPSPFWKTLIN